MTSDGFAGARVDGPDPALFGLHCTLARGRTLVPLAKALGRAAVLPDLPGHGHRPWDRQGRYFEACQEVLDAAPSGRVPVFGHSFGGVLALHFALAQPERVGALMLYEPVAFVYAHEAGDPEYPKFLDRNAGFAEAMSQGDLSAATRQFLSFWSDGPPDELPASALQVIESQIDLVPAQEP
ncbi:MAG: alpha/beta fold hydrolase, partial [Pseudomonadota bacterium]